MPRVFLPVPCGGFFGHLARPIRAHGVVRAGSAERDESPFAFSGKPDGIIPQAVIIQKRPVLFQFHVLHTFRPMWGIRPGGVY